ncbi:MAG: VWA domain-containing protein [Nanoarchaeota archaeon]|nr:VWA domain-containing protein [Nanoarchaeota archaeon]
MKVVVTRSYSQEKTELKKTSDIEELSGKLKKQDEENKLMNSVLDNDKDTIDDGKTIKEALNQGISCFTPDLMFEQLVKNYSIAKQLYGPTLIKQLTTYDERYVNRNIRIPEFQKELKKNIENNIGKLKDDGFLNREGVISDKGVELASLILYTEELDNLMPKGILGEKIHKKHFIYGDKEDTKPYKKGDRYRDIAIKKSIKLAVRRGHSKLGDKDLQSFEKQSKGQIYLIYGLDASGSMKGKKIETCKKAGIALAYKAIQERDKVGLLVFGSEIKESIEPTDDFKRLIMEITRMKASKETNIEVTIKKAIELFPTKDVTKHLILLTDAMPTVGEEPEKDTLEAVSLARSNGITISLVGVQLDDEGKKFAEKIANLGEGKLYIVKNLEDLDKIVLEDYYSIV